MVEFNYFSTEHTRTAGTNERQYKSVQAWKTKRTPQLAEKTSQIKPVQKQILADLDNAAMGKVGAFNHQLETSLSYADTGNKINVGEADNADEGYQFHDVIDIINPLQHLPVVSMVYRELTGDQIHPMSQIIGGALYGGPVGAVTGTINAISQMQTGKDLGGYALAMAGIGENKTTNITDKNNPEAQLNNVAKNINRNQPIDELPGSALSFVNLSEPNKGYQRIKVADGRTAGSMLTQKQVANYQQSSKVNGFSEIQESNKVQKVNFGALPKREEITSISISAMPPRQEI